MTGERCRTHKCEEECKAICDDANGQCEYTVNEWTFESCGGCPDEGSSCSGVEEVRPQLVAFPNFFFFFPFL